MNHLNILRRQNTKTLFVRVENSINLNCETIVGVNQRVAAENTPTALQCSAFLHTFKTRGSENQSEDRALQW